MKLRSLNSDAKIRHINSSNKINSRNKINAKFSKKSNLHESIHVNLTMWTVQ